MLSTKEFWLGLGERGLKTFIQSWLAVFGVSVGAEFVIRDTSALFALPWETATLTAAIATLLSVATSIGNANFTAGTPAAPLVDNGPVDVGPEEDGYTAYADEPLDDDQVDDEPVDVGQVMASLPRRDAAR